MQSKTQPIRCLIFDCDGVLVDSEHLGLIGLVQLVAEMGVTLQLEECIERYRGWRFAAVLEDLHAQANLSFPPDFEDIYRARAALVFEERLEAIPGIHDALRALPHPKCVASNAPRKKLNHTLQLTKLREHFGDNVFSAYDLQAWKPDPTLFLHAAKEMGFPPQQCAVIEDSEVGIQAAEAAGMHALLYDPHHRGTPGPKRTLFHHMHTLPSLL